MDKKNFKIRFSTIINLIFAISFLSTLYSCGPPKRFAIDSNQLNISNSGIVLGKVTKQRFYGLFMYDADGNGRGIEIKNKNTGEAFTYTGAYYFEMRLPEGTYQLTFMGTPNGGIIPRTNPFEFTIKNGEIKYIGSIVSDRDLKIHMDKLNVQRPILGEHIFSVKDYGEPVREGFIGIPTKQAQEPFFTFYIIDERDDVVARFREKYPEIETNNIQVGFMK